MAAIVEGTNNQVTIYKNGQVQTAQEGRREGESASELNRKLAEGWSTTAPSDAGTSQPAPNTDAAMAVARSLFSFFPEAVLKDYANAWIKYDDTTLAIAEVRTKPSWKKEFGFLQRAYGRLIMSEAEMLSTKASYAQTLREVDNI